MHIHTFPYSKRDGTKASIMDNQVDGNIKKERVKKVIELSNKMEEEYYKNSIGKIYEGVTEVRGDGKVVVHTSNFIPVILNSNTGNNEVVKVKITKVDKLNVYGEII